MIGNENFDLFVYLTGGLAVLLGSFAAAAGIGRHWSWAIVCLL